MSKSKNIRRSKLLHKKKQDRERQLHMKDQLENDKRELLIRNESDQVKVIDRDLNGTEKISILVSEMVKEVLDTAVDHEDAKGILTMGIVAWNCAIIKQLHGEEKFQETIKLFKAEENSYERELLNEYIDIKCSKYPQYRDFIIDYKLSLNKDGSMNFVVLSTTSMV